MTETGSPNQYQVMNTRQKIRRALILISFILFPITLDYFSPYLIIDGASQGIINGSFLVFAGLLVTAMILGRAWCGWLCPGAGIQEACFGINNKKVKGGKFNWIKYYIWIPWVSIIILVAVMAGGFHRINPWHLMEGGISVAEPGNYFIYFTVVGLFVVLAFAVGKRAFCHYVCWMAPFVIIGSKIKDWIKLPSLQLVAYKDDCKQCGTCIKNCPMSLEVKNMVQTGSMKNTECILCGTCVDNCPQSVIKFSWKSGSN